MNCDVAILGGGMVGLCLAYQLLERKEASKIVIIEKEKALGLHSSGRNSGVLHAGLYYKPDSLKAKVCVSGAKRLREWIEERRLPINICGKVIVPQDLELDNQLDELYKRGINNGASVEIWDEKQLKDFVPEAYTSSGRALWSPNTSVVKPKEVLKQLSNELMQRGVKILTSQKGWNVSLKEKQLQLSKGENINYAHLINATGLFADRVAHEFGVGEEFSLLPFKGLYWSIKKDCPIKLKTNVYPVPDLNVPFLGVHFTPSADEDPIVNIGPTATPAFGRENYRAFDELEPLSAFSNLFLLANQYINNSGGFRRYVHEQSPLCLKPFLIKAAQKLIPKIRLKHIKLSNKVGIRSQLYNKNTGKLEDDFLCLDGPSSTHVMNAISPAFTASFALADLILDKVNLNFK